MRPLQQWSRQVSRYADDARRVCLLRRALPPGLRRMLRHRVARTGVALLPPALLLLYIFCHSHANWESCLASLRELNHDHGAPARELGRALSLARSLRDRQTLDSGAWHAAVRLAADALSARLAALWRIPARLAPLLALFGWLH